jgi:hypothetical protein
MPGTCFYRIEGKNVASVAFNLMANRLPAKLHRSWHLLGETTQATASRHFGVGGSSSILWETLVLPAQKELWPCERPSSKLVLVVS